MPCYSPLSVWQTDGGEIVFSERGDIRRALELPCGQCWGCRLERSRQWAIRCMHESQMHAWSSFITLTYDDDHVPKDGSLRYRDFQLFMKRLRKVYCNARFFMCGEYGERTARPHYHACLFGVHFCDRVLFRESDSGFRIYTSKVLSSLWTDGFASVGDVSFESAAYVARYVMKKVTGDKAADHYRRLDLETGEFYWIVPEFCHMSLKPGIGSTWFSKWYRDVYPHDFVYVNGVKAKPPKFYDRLLTVLDGFTMDDIKYQRQLDAVRFVEDCSVDRLRARAIVARARMSFKPRNLE